MAKSRGRKFAEITSPTSGVFDLTSVPTITNAKLQNSAMTLAGSSVSLGGTGVADTDALSEGSSNLYFTNARVQSFLGGGTLAGNIVVPDNRSIYLGSNSDFRLVHNTTNTQLINATGALQVTSNGGFDVTGAATFSSTIAATGATFTGDSAITKETPVFTLTDSSASRTLQLIVDDNNSVVRASGPLLLQSGGASSAITLDTSQNATFGGTGTFAGGAANNNDDANILTLNASQHARLLVDTSSTSGHRATLALESNGNETTLTTTGSASFLNVDTGDLTIDVAGELVIDTDLQGSGNGILLKDAGTLYGSIFRSSSHLHLKAETQDKNLLFLTNNGGSELTAMTIQSDGNVGIGTTAPNNYDNNAAGISSNLVVADSGHSGIIVISGTSSDAAISFGDGTGTAAYRGAIAYVNSQDQLYFKTASTNKMVISSSGNVGIGTNNPGQKLDVQGTVMLEKARLSTNDGTTYWDLRRDSSTGHFVISDDGLGDVITVRQDTGVVGIGVASPSYKLHVDTSANIPAVFDSSANETYLYIRNSNATTGRKAYVAFAPANDIHGAAVYAEAMEDFSTSANRTADLVFETRNNGTIADRMRIKANGDVGIGTSSVFGATSNRRCLSINGTSSTSLNIGVGGAQKAYMYSEGTYARVATMGNIPLQLGTNDTERMRVTEGSTADSVVIWNNASNSSVGRNFRVMAYDADSYFALGNDGNNSMQLTMTNSAGATKFQVNAHSGITTIGSTLYMGGSIYHSGGDRINFTGSNYYVLNASNVGVRLINGNTSWTTQSDERTKENITDIGSVLSKIKNYRCIEYNLKSYDKKMYGFIAQDWETDFPHLVDEDDNFTIQSDGTAKAKDAEDNTSTDAVKTLSYNETIPVLLRAIQEQQELIETLQIKVAALEGE